MPLQDRQPRSCPNRVIHHSHKEIALTSFCRERLVLANLDKSLEGPQNPPTSWRVSEQDILTTILNSRASAN